MKRHLFTLAIAAALVAPASARALTPGSTYDFCGGSAFTFCASINLSVVARTSGTGYTVYLTVLNRSMPFDGNAPGQFVSIGLDNVMPPGETLMTPNNFHLRQGTWNGTGYTYTDVCGATPTCWNMATNKVESGVNVDFDANTGAPKLKNNGGTGGNQWSVTSNCLTSEPHWNNYPINTCARGDDQTLWRPIQISFDVNQNITSANFAIKAIANTSTHCGTALTGVDQCKMVPPPIITPEPGSMALVGTGILGVFGGARFRRRRYQG